MLVDMVPQCICLADVGCDHGMLGEAVLQTGRAERVIASDVSEASLHKAQRRFEGRSEVSIRLGYGLDVLKPHEADVICMSGMGSSTIESILRAGRNIARTAAYLVLGPNRNANMLREFLRNAHYEICRERIVKESGRFYPIILAHPCKCAPPRDSLREYYGLGVNDLHDPVFQDYLKDALLKTDRVLSRVEKVHADPARIMTLRRRRDQLLTLIMPISRKENAE